MTPLGAIKQLFSFLAKPAGTGDRPKHAHHNTSPLPNPLYELSPILYDDMAYSRFWKHYFSTPKDTLATLQAQSLSPIFQALIQSGLPLSHDELIKLTQDYTKYQHFTQLQRPIIARLSDHFSVNLTAILEIEYPKHAHSIFTYAFDKLHGKTTLINDPDTQTPYQYFFTFLTIKQITRAPHGPLEREDLLSIPLIRLEPEILRNTLKHSGHDLLHALQDCTQISNHDYIHAATGPLINAYWSDRLIPSLRPRDTFFMRAQRAMKNIQTPAQLHLNTLYPAYPISNTTRKKSPLNLAAYDINGHLEGHALLAHKQLFLDHLDTSPLNHAVNRYFASLATLMRSINKQDPKQAAIIGLYYSTLLYHRLLHMLPHTHPTIQNLEHKAANLPIRHGTWKRALNTRLNSIKNSNILRKKLELYCTPQKHKTYSIRALAHASGMAYWEKLHYAPTPTKIPATKTALPDLHRVYQTAHHDMQTVRQHAAKIAPCQKAQLCANI